MIKRQIVVVLNMLVCTGALVLTGPLVAQEQATLTEKAQSVRPGINDNFLSDELNVQEWLGRFEVESREVYSARDEVIKAIDIKPGMRVADIGAGTGFYTRMFAECVGQTGWVYAVDIVPKFLQHIQTQAADDKITNITTVLCPQDGVALPPDSVDAAYICDTYHHFEFPAATLATLFRAIRPGGTLVIVDFERIPGVSREWLLTHVRAGKDEVREEVVQAGFAFEGEVKIEGFEENYFLRFRKRK
ncbi:MAG: methyltransferase domain-containing protein [Planctomycetales bacterium]|nr:methyltransferase domain-containing protein [Planctomycetales bacterium]